LPGSAIARSTAAKIITTLRSSRRACYVWPIFLGFMAEHQHNRRAFAQLHPVGRHERRVAATHVDALTVMLVWSSRRSPALVHLYSWDWTRIPDQPALLCVSVAVRLRDADARDREQPRPFFGWEGVGLAITTLLIGFCSTSRQCGRSRRSSSAVRRSGLHAQHLSARSWCSVRSRSRDSGHCARGPDRRSASSATASIR
jgi:hypothetical protein